MGERRQHRAAITAVATLLAIGAWPVTPVRADATIVVNDDQIAVEVRK